MVEGTGAGRAVSGSVLRLRNGLHYNALKYYDPEDGRFITQDAIWVAGGQQPIPLNLSGWINPPRWQCEVVRGVSANHPEIANARNGIVKRGNINSTPWEETHNLGGVSGESSFTS